MADNLMRSFSTYSASAQTDSVVIPPGRGQRTPVVHLSAVKGGNASDILYVLPCNPAYESIVSTQVSASGTSVTLDSNSDGTKVGGHTATTSDYLVVARNSTEWIVAGISGVTNDAANDEIDLECAGEFMDGASNVGAIIPAGARAFVVPAADVLTFAIGTTQYTDMKNYAVGFPGCPIAVLNVGAAAAAHFTTGVVEYRDM